MKIKLKSFLFSILIMLISCKQTIKADNDQIFERQASDLSIDEMTIGDDINYWGADAPKAAIFILKTKTGYLKNFAIKPLRFKESDRTQEELNKKIATDPIYQVEVYEMYRDNKVNIENPDICKYIYSNFAKATKIYKIQSLSFRIKERNWIEINKKVDPDSLIFLRVGVAESFQVIKNNTTDSLIINAKKNDKIWEDFTPMDKKKVFSWACQEANFLETNTLEGIYYNPDIVFNVE
ncbi:MAG: hypothetical protein H7263_05025 [Candidatus Sericytochromatia bacterium]|nr:hypothetical protein [Candidatus Sericytochromatia bacterium]